MNFEFDESFHKRAVALTKKDKLLKKQLAKQFNLFSENPLHPYLRLHKLKGKRTVNYAIWIKGDLRALAVKIENRYIFFDLISHDEY